MKTAFVEVRSQHSNGSSRYMFGGPDTYVMVQIVPFGVQPLKRLDRQAAKRRGIDLIFCGEGYSNRQQTTRSMLGGAITRAKRIAAEVNGDS